MDSNSSEIETIINSDINASLVSNDNNNNNNDDEKDFELINSDYLKRVDELKEKNNCETKIVINKKNDDDFNIKFHDFIKAHYSIDEDNEDDKDLKGGLFKCEFQGSDDDDTNSKDDNLIELKFPSSSEDSNNSVNSVESIKSDADDEITILNSPNSPNNVKIRNEDNDDNGVNELASKRIKLDSIEPVIDQKLVGRHDSVDITESKPKRIKLDSSVNLVDDEQIEILNKSLSNSSICEIEHLSDDDICFIGEEKPILPSNYVNYYANDGEVDEKEVMRRWRCKKLSDPTVNLSKSNYRSRLFYEKNAPQAQQRKFKECLFTKSNTEVNKVNDESTSSKNPVHLAINGSPGRFQLHQQQKKIPEFTNKLYTDFSAPVRENQNKMNENKNELNNEELDDKTILGKRIEELKSKYKQMDREAYLRYKDQQQSLTDFYNQQVNFLHYFYMQEISNAQTNKETKKLKNAHNQKNAECNKNYHTLQRNLKREFLDQSNELKNSIDSQIDALKELYESGKYKKGKLNEYFAATLFQPPAIRRKYNDNGLRQVLLPEARLKNILIEDTIYNHYYGEPK